MFPYVRPSSSATKGDYRVEITYELPNSLRRRRKKRSLDNERSSVYSLVQDLFSKYEYVAASFDGCIWLQFTRYTQYENTSNQNDR